ncbi:MAG TPA: trehalose-phosphatase [Acidiferrobacter sp.]|nr:trehalose-phosphatase [Acidiferrobacter sp.]
MKELGPGPRLEAFLAELATARSRLLVLDYDGTLAPFAPDRKDAVLYPGVAPLLKELMHNGTRVAFITGRPALDLAERLPLPGIEIFGAHGHEYLGPTGELERMPIAADVQVALTNLAGLIQSAGYDSALECKHGTVAIHWRKETPDTQRALKQLAYELSTALPTAIQALPFDGGFEFRVRGYNKGTALTHILARHPGAVVAFLGDDLTDEDAFAALPPTGLGVLVRSELRDTKAQLWIQPPEELRQFLTLWNTTAHS